MNVMVVRSTRVEVAALALGLFLLSCGIVTAALTGDDKICEGMSNGSAADWVAAVGTWAMGIGAAGLTFYLWSAEQRKKDGAEDRVLAGIQAKLMRITQMGPHIPRYRPVGTGVHQNKGRLRAARRLLEMTRITPEESQVMCEARQGQSMELQMELEITLFAIDEALARPSWKGGEMILAREALGTAMKTAKTVWDEISRDREK
ncbi:hypothetical protein ACJ7C5_06640 [Nocardiopsis yanglingensis]